MYQDLIKAKQRSNNEFYTPYDRIKEYMQEVVKHYDFTNKKVYCNCGASEFCKFFTNNFHTLGLNKLIVEAGDYRSIESKRFLEEADIVITNPPFSVFRDFYKTIKKKDFIIVGPLLSLNYVDVFNDIKANNYYKVLRVKVQRYRWIIIVDLNLK